VNQTVAIRLLEKMGRTVMVVEWTRCRPEDEGWAHKPSGNDGAERLHVLRVEV